MGAGQAGRGVLLSRPGDTLAPPLLDRADSVDQFLYETRAGFCEHYASAFTVVMRAADSGRGGGELPWKLLGVHSARLDMHTRDQQQDESLGLNCAWYADILMTLTAAAGR